MQLFYKFVRLASVILASSVVANFSAAANSSDDLPVCDNRGPLHEDVGDCHVGNSKGMIPKKDCQGQIGVSFYYYCEIAGNPICFPESEFVDELTGGECFVELV